MRYLFNDGWEFSKQKPGTDITSVPGMRFERVNIPHDWLIYQTGDLYEDSVGFYRKRFILKKREARRYEIYFEGVYMDTSVYINGKKAGEWKYGYSSFFFDVTGLLTDGENEIIVKADFRSPNSRWYSGAGIYRDVYFIDEQQTHIVTDSLYVSAKPVTDEKAVIDAGTDLSGEWEISVSAEIAAGKADCSWNGDYDAKELTRLGNRLKLTLVLPEFGKSHSALAGAVISKVFESGAARIEFKENVNSPELWSLDNPKLYECLLYLFDPENDGENSDEKEDFRPISINDGKVTDGYSTDKKNPLKPGEPKGEKTSTKFGFRSFTFDNDKGFFINGVHTKLNGVCEHHDLGALGAAFNKAAMRRKFEILREMGVNAVRTAHNMPATGLLDLADEMGFIILDEAFDMWEGSKTEFDYGRFFKEWQERDVRSFVRRDRNHPCIFMWSIGNEIYDTHKDAHGQEITRYLQREVRENDFYGNAVIGIGSNYMPWEGAQKCADILKYAGYNYGEKLYDRHHGEHPDWYIFGSETSSTVQSRGIYHFPYERSTLADDNMQCSGLGNSTTSWGAPNPEYCIIAERDHEFSMGQFLWSGFDYIGEPTPYHTRNSYFGQIDTAGFKKDSFYIYKSAWTDCRKEPFVHVFPYWDYNEGQIIDVRVASNAPWVELFVNGKSLGRQKIDHAFGKTLTGNYKVPYTKGEITAVSYDENGEEIARESRHSFSEAVSLKLNVYRPERELIAGCGDMAFIEVSAFDAEGFPVENASNLVKVSVIGAGFITGLDNGDSTDTDEYKGYEKRLFAGRMLICVAVGDETGEIRVKVLSEGLTEDEIVLKVAKKDCVSGISLLGEDYGNIGYRKLFSEKEIKRSDRIRIRKINLSCDTFNRKLDSERPETVVTAEIFPAAAAENFGADSLIWKVVNDDGIESNIAKVTKTDGLSATVKALGDGSFRLRCMSECGCDCVKVISELEFTAEGIGAAFFDPYGFIAGGMYSYHEGDIGIGNDHGFSTARGARSVAGFDNIDFGDHGSDEITIQIFSLSNDLFKFRLYDGIPGSENSECVLDGEYQKPMIWNVYQPETYKLTKKLKGIKSLYFEAGDKVHVGGFTFKKINKAFELLSAGECDNVYGDSFDRKADRIDRIGNNVTVEFFGMDFGERISSRLEITGKTDIPVNTIHVIFDNGSEKIRDIVEFKQNGRATQEFAVSGYTGNGTVRFIFLPGSSFDFESFRFS